MLNCNEYKFHAIHAVLRVSSDIYVRPYEKSRPTIWTITTIYDGFARHWNVDVYQIILALSFYFREFEKENPTKPW